MKQFLVTLLVSWCLCISAPAQAAITVLSHTSGYGDGNTATTSAISTTGASLIVVNVSSYTPGGSFTLSDSASNTWTALTAYGPNGGSTQATTQLFYAASPTTSGTHTFTASGTGVYPVVGVVAVSGTHASPYTSQESGDHNNGIGTSLAPGSLTPSEGNCLVVTGAAGLDHTAPTADGGFTSDSGDNVAGMSGGIAWLVQTSAAASNPSWSWSGGAAMAASQAVFKSAAGGGGAAAGGLLLLGVGQ